MNITKTKLYCFFLIIFIFVFLFLFFSFFENEQQSWQQNVDTNFEVVQEVNDNGDIVNVNYISTPQQLAGMFSVINQNSIFADDFSTNADLSDKIYKLKNDINLGGKSWTCSNLKSGYTFDGNHCSINNLTISASSGENIGFIAYNYGTIKNLMFKNVNVSFTKENTAITLGVVAGCSSGTIENCSVLSGIIFCAQNNSLDSSSRQVGGIVGRIEGGIITKCVNFASVKNGGHIGGIVGVLSEGTVDYCYNYGQVYSNVYKNIRLGGIVGEATASATKIEKSYNSGEISATNTGYLENSDVAVGGIVGYCYVPVEQCENAGDIIIGGGSSNSTIQTAYVGGICGITVSNVENCINSAAQINSATKAFTPSNSTIEGLAEQLSAQPNGFSAVPLGGGGGDTDSGRTNGVPDIDTTDWESLVDMVFCTGLIKVKRKIEISGSIFNNYAGGIVGFAKAGTISNCLNQTKINEISSKESVSYNLYVLDYDINQIKYIVYPNYQFEYIYYTQTSIAYKNEDATITNCYSTTGQTFESSFVDKTNKDAVGYEEGIAYYQHSCPHHTNDRSILNIWGYIYKTHVDICVTLEGYNSQLNGDIGYQEYGIYIEKEEKDFHGKAYAIGSGIPSGFSSSVWANSDDVRSSLHLKCFYWMYTK